MAKSRKNTPRPFLIDDETLTDPKVKDAVLFPTIAGERKGHGYDSLQVPSGFMFAPPSEMKTFTDDEMSEIIKRQDREKSSLVHLRETMADGKPHASLDQNGQGYCWAYSNTQAVMFKRARDRQPYVRLSAHSVACVIKNFRDQGGWCGLSAEFIKEKGVAPVENWPEKSMDRKYNTPSTWKEALKYRIDEDWVEMRASVYDRNMSFRQVATSALNGQPCAVDFNWWSHSVCCIGVAEVERGSFGLIIINSWTDRWGDKGLAVLRGNKTIPDGATGTRSVTVSA